MTFYKTMLLGLVVVVAGVGLLYFNDSLSLDLKFDMNLGHASNEYDDIESLRDQCLWIICSTRDEARTSYSNDVLTWFDSQLPEGTYVAGHAELFDAATQKWVSLTEVLQPFKTKVDRNLKSVYWRKDDLEKNFYGEIFRYDDNNIFLRQETNPIFGGIDPAGTWDARPDKFRLFQSVNAGSTPKAQALGRILAPRTYVDGWNISQYFNTYYCYGWTEFENGTCPMWQSNFYDNSVSVKMLKNFSTTFDGEMDDPRWQASSEFKNFDQVLVIDQRMNNDDGRERFFFGVKNGVYYGFIRWDALVVQNGQWVIIQRAVGLKTDTSLAVSFDGFEERASRDILSTPVITPGITTPTHAPTQTPEPTEEPCTRWWCW